MNDPVKEYEKLQKLTEGVFNKLSNFINTPPSAELPSSAMAAKSEYLQKKYGTLYKVDGFPEEKNFRASDLLRLYKDSKIHNNTEITIRGEKKPFNFSELMKTEPFYSELLPYFKQDNNSQEEPTKEKEPSPYDQEASYFIRWETQKGDYTKPKGKTTVKSIARQLVNYPRISKTLQIWDESNKKYVGLMSHSIWDRVERLMNQFPKKTRKPIKRR